MDLLISLYRWHLDNLGRAWGRVPRPTPQADKSPLVIDCSDRCPALSVGIHLPFASPVWTSAEVSWRGQAGATVIILTAAKRLLLE